jgi:hypothetical protein
MLVEAELGGTELLALNASAFFKSVYGVTAHVVSQGSRCGVLPQPRRERLSDRPVCGYNQSKQTGARS